jgi:superfamily I DNA/RNA helicase
MIDEWQDTSLSQLELVKLFAKCTRGISVVGDPHQSIYAFRGAEFSNWKRLAELLSPKVVFLSTNYRSTSVISKVPKKKKFRFFFSSARKKQFRFVKV